MAGLQYFLPKVLLSGIAQSGRLNTAILTERGCAAGFVDCRTLDDVARAEISGKGPDGNPGMVLAPLPVGSREAPRRLGYYPQDDSIRWTQISDLLWIGLDTVMPPAPAELARRTLHTGYPVLLGDGNEWIAPTIMQPDGNPALPCDLYRDGRGELMMQMQAGHEDLWAKAGWIIDTLGGKRSYVIGDGLDVCIAGLGYNYRIGHAENRVLHLLSSNTDMMERIFFAMVGLPFDADAGNADDIAKKNDPPTSPVGGPGGPDCCPDIGLPAATSTSSH